MQLLVCCPSGFVESDIKKGVEHSEAVETTKLNSYKAATAWTCEAVKQRFVIHISRSL